MPGELHYALPMELLAWSCQSIGVMVEQINSATTLTIIIIIRVLSHRCDSLDYHRPLSLRGFLLTTALIEVTAASSHSLNPGFT